MRFPLPDEPPARRAAVSLFLVTHSYPPVLGGSEIEAQRVCAALTRRGHRVTVLCAGGPPMPDVSRWVDPAGVPVRIFGRRCPAFLRDYVFALAVFVTLYRERRNYQLVYFLMQGLHLATGLAAARLAGKRVVMKISGSGIIPVMRNSWIGRLELRWLDRWARRIMILNPGMEQEARAAGLDPSRLLWMPNPVDTDDFCPCAPAARAALRDRLGIPREALVAIYVGRLAPEKELPSLIGAMSSLAARVPQALAILVGDGPMRAELEERARACGVSERIRFAGRQTVAEVRQWLQAGDVFTLVSSNEGFPCSLVEAMAVALPSVVSRIPANRQLVDCGVHGFDAEVRDEAGIADALAALFLDEAARARMGRAARRRVLDRYAVDKVIDLYEALFAEALA